MVFNSISFILFFVVFFPLYWKVNDSCSVRVRNILVLAGSYIFYGSWDWRFLGLLIFSSLMDFIIGRAMGSAEDPRVRKNFLVLSLVINLGILGFFKYCNFFIDSFIQLMSVFSVPAQVSRLQIILPVGISFYTFQSLAYIISIYRRQLEPSRDLGAFMAYVSFFPQLVAGPIERPMNLLPQFFDRKIFDRSRVVGGLRLVLWGFFKKSVIADNLGIVADRIFDPANHSGSLTILAGLLFFTFQIYCDFSGYSDIARGIARMLGFELMGNFRTPYLAGSFREFWHRWHISLSTWFRDYVYIPLGGSHQGKLRTNFNLLVTFVLSGFWHGPKFTFLLWGGFHGIALVAENFFRQKAAQRNIIYSSLVFITVGLFWLPFRSVSIHHLGDLLHQILLFDMDPKELVGIMRDTWGPVKIFAMSMVFIIFIYLERKISADDFSFMVSGWKAVPRMTTYYLLLFLILFLSNYNVKPYFIYFQF